MSLGVVSPPSISLNQLPSPSVDDADEKQVPYVNEQYTTQHQFKIHVGIDFGTDGSGLAYALQDGKTYIHNLWKDVASTEKPRTSVLFDNHGEVQCHGNQAVIQYISSMSNEGWKLFERFKMNLYEDPTWKTQLKSRRHLLKKVDLKEEIQATNSNKISEQSETVFVAQLKFLKSEAMNFINRNFKRKKQLKFNQDEIQYCLSVPAIWSDKAKQRMKDWAIKAGLVPNHIPNQLKIVYEPDCASLSIQHALLRNLQRQKLRDDEKSESKRKRDNLHPHKPRISIDVPFEKGDKYILLDAGGGTCDVACHEIMGEFQIAEVLHPSGGPWGACGIDEEFVLMLDDIFSREWMNEFKQTSPNMYQQLLHNFIHKSKMSFYRHDDDANHNAQYHDIQLPFNFGDFLIDKLEENEEMSDDDCDAEELLDDYLKQRCIELYKNEKMIEMKEITNPTSYILSLHFSLWKKLFNIVVEPIVDHIDKILANKAMKHCKYIFLVGGFSNAKYLQERIKDQFSVDAGLEVVIPQLPQLCVVDGAARYGLRPNFMKIRKLANTYGIQTNKSLNSLKKIIHKFPSNYVEENTYFDKELKQAYVKGCFCWFVQRNEPLNIGDKPKRKAVYKMTKDQNKMMIEIFQIDKEKPMTTSKKEGSRKIGKLIIDLPDSDQYKVWVEFKWSDTMLTVLSYPDGRRDLKRESIVKYQ